MLFDARPYRAEVLTREDIPALQRFFEESPEYFVAVNGEAPRADEAREEFEDLPPPGYPYRDRYLIKYLGRDGGMVAMANALSDLFAPGIWHIGLFIVGSHLHGSGAAAEMYGALEAWMRAGGARWARLGVVEGNARAERFWEKAGYVEVRKREGVEMGKRINTLRVMVKPLDESSLEDYLALAARDRPD
jgi:GNAT superfamily N-acetyltransferase